MEKIDRKYGYQPGTVDQGFNPFKAADITPYLRENQRTEEANLRNRQDQQMRDVKLQQRSERMALEGEQATRKLKQYVADIEATQKAKEMNQLAQFSDKLFDMVHDVREQRYKDRAAEIQVLFSEDEQARAEAEVLQQQNEVELSNMAAEDMQLAQAAAKNDEPYTFVQRMRSLSGEDRYLYATAHAAKIGETFEAFATKQMRENDGILQLKNGAKIQINNPQNEAETSAVIGHLLKEHIKNNDAGNLPPGLAATYIYKQTDKARASLLANWSKEYAKNESFKDNELSFEGLKTRFRENPNAVQEYLNRVSLNWNDAGTQRLRYSGAHKRLFDELLVLATGDADERRLADEIIAQYEQTTLNGQPFSVLQAGRIKELRAKVRVHDSEARSTQITAEKNQVDDNIKEQIKALGTNFTQADVGTIIRFAHQAYGGIGLTFNDNNLQKLWADASLGGQKLDELRDLTAAKFLHGNISEEDWMRLPDSLKEEFASDWATAQKLQQGVFKAYKESIEITVTGNQYVNAAPKSAKSLAPLIVRDLQQEFDTLVKGYMSNPDSPYREDEKAAEKALDQIITKFTTGVKEKGGRYHHDPQKGFSNYLMFDTDDRKVTSDFRERQERVLSETKLIGKSAFAKPALLGSTDQIREMKARVEGGQGVDPFLARTAQLNGLSWMEVLNMQLDAQGDKKVETIEQIMQVQNQQTPEIQRQLRAIQNGYASQVDVRRLKGELQPRPAYAKYVAPTPARGNLDKAAIQDAMRQAGWPESEINVMSAVFMGESGGNPTIDTVQSGLDPDSVYEYSIGIGQINYKVHKPMLERYGITEDDLRTPIGNMRAALLVWQQQGRGAWSVYLNGKYKEHL